LTGHAPSSRRPLRWPPSTPWVASSRTRPGARTTSWREPVCSDSLQWVMPGPELQAVAWAWCSDSTDCVRTYPCSRRPHSRNSRRTRSTTGRRGPCCRTKRAGRARSSSSRSCSTNRKSGDSRGRSRSGRPLAGGAAAGRVGAVTFVVPTEMLCFTGKKGKRHPDRHRQQPRPPVADWSAAARSADRTGGSARLAFRRRIVLRLPGVRLQS
jgi:hypothetical protein